MSGSRERQLRMELENGNEIIHDRVVTSGQSALSCATGGKNPDLVGSSLPVVTHPKKGKSKRGTMAKRNQNSNPKIIPVVFLFYFCSIIASSEFRYALPHLSLMSFSMRDRNH